MGLKANPVKFLSVVGVVRCKIPQLAVKLNVPGDAGDLTSLAARLGIDPTSASQVLLSHVVDRPEVVTSVLHTASLTHLTDRGLSGALPPKSSSVSKELPTLRKLKLLAIPVVTGLVDLIGRGDELLRSSDNLVRRVADVLDLDLTVVLITDDEAVGAHHAEDASVQVVGLKAVVAVDDQKLDKAVTHLGALLHPLTAHTDDVLGVHVAPLARANLLGIPSFPAILLKGLDDAGGGDESVSVGSPLLVGAGGKHGRSLATEHVFVDNHGTVFWLNVAPKVGVDGASDESAQVSFMCHIIPLL